MKLVSYPPVDAEISSLWVRVDDFALAKKPANLAEANNKHNTHGIVPAFRISHTGTAR